MPANVGCTLRTINRAPPFHNSWVSQRLRNDCFEKFLNFPLSPRMAGGKGRGEGGNF